jgi:hypothetical protein
MARKDDIKMLFDFMIEILKEDNEVKTQEIKPKVLIAEETQPKIQKFEIFDATKAKSIMDKIENKNHDDAIIKKALKIQETSYKKEIEDLKASFNKKIEKDKAEEESQQSITGDTVTVN